MAYFSLIIGIQVLLIVISGFQMYQQACTLIGRAHQKRCLHTNPEFSSRLKRTEIPTTSPFSVQIALGDKLYGSLPEESCPV
jgi:hypothetical protein